MSRRDWRVVVDEASNVMRLVHLAGRKDPFDVEEMRGRLLKRRQQLYEDELAVQAGRVGCPNRRGRLTTGPSLKALDDQSRADAESIINTYNYDLALAIQHIRQEVPTANRHVYSYRLRNTWEPKRVAWKDKQIAQHTEGQARALAQQDFIRFNAIEGYAVLEPKEAVCPVCQGWVTRGQVRMRVAMNNPPPYHPSCPHGWRTEPDKLAKSECPNLWMGE